MFANVVDIRKITTNGKRSRKLLEEPRGSIIAVDYDPVQKRVKYHTNTATHMAEESVPCEFIDGHCSDYVFTTAL